MAHKLHKYRDGYAVFGIICVVSSRKATGPLTGSPKQRIAFFVIYFRNMAKYESIEDLKIKWWYRLFQVILTCFYLASLAYGIGLVVIEMVQPNYVLDRQNSTVTCKYGTKKSYSFFEGNVYEPVFPSDIQRLCNGNGNQEIVDRVKEMRDAKFDDKKILSLFYEASEQDWRDYVDEAGKSSSPTEIVNSFVLDSLILSEIDAQKVLNDPREIYVSVHTVFKADKSPWDLMWAKIGYSVLTILGISTVFEIIRSVFNYIIAGKYFPLKFMNIFNKK